MKKTLFLFLLSVSALMNLHAMEKCKRKGPTFVDFGYNKFVVSPYSQTIAVTPFNNESGIEIFKRSEYNEAFFQLAPHYCPQQHINSCGIASAVIILNTVYVNRGETPPISKSGSWYVPEEDTVYGQYVWTEDNFYNKNVSHLVSQAVVECRKKVDGQYHPGIELDRLTRCLNAQGLTAKAYHANSAAPKDIEAFRALVKQLTASPNQYLIINYNLDLYTAQGGGHFSPVGAYETISDSVLILDTRSASNTWIWAKLTDLYKSMNTRDGEVYRGYILVDAI